MDDFLSVCNLKAGYGRAQVLFDMSFAVGAGEVVTLLGRNGMGRSTTIKCALKQPMSRTPTCPAGPCIATPFRSNRTYYLPRRDDCKTRRYRWGCSSAGDDLR